MQQQKQLKVLLIGDSCTDEYVYGTCERLNPEAPVPILKLNRKETKKGMAWNVRENLMSFGMEVCIVTNEETIIKTRYIDEKHNQQILRVDSDPILNSMQGELPEGRYDALVISDYNKGFLTTEKISDLVNSFDGPVFIDTKKNQLPELNAYIKVNEHEWSNFKCSVLFNKLIITKGGKGAWYKDELYPAEKVNVFDVVGAGDTFLSALVYFYLKYGTIEYAIPYANKAAAIAVSNFGTYILSEEDVNEICD